MATKSIVRYRNRPKAKHHARAKMTIPLAAIGGLVPLAMAGLEGYYGKTVCAEKVAARPGFQGLASQVGFCLTGYSVDTKQWYPAEMLRGLGPILIGVGVHKAANRLGINRMLASAGVPLLRI